MVNINPTLTKEERDVLILASVHPNLKHLSIIEIGQRLGMTVTTVKTHIHQACIKLGADNRNEAVLMAVKRGEICITDLLSLEELAEILCSLDPEVLWRIADAVRQNQMKKSLPETGEQLNCMDRRQGGILTNRERDVLILASYGMTNVEIAEQLCMSTSAVRTFLNRAFNKLGACKKADAVQIALKLREISVGEISSLDELANFLAPMGAESIEKLAKILDGKLEKESVPLAC